MKKIGVGKIPAPKIRNKLRETVREIWLQSGWGIPKKLKQENWPHYKAFGGVK